MNEIQKKFKKLLYSEDTNNIALALKIAEGSPALKPLVNHRVQLANDLVALGKFDITATDIHKISALNAALLFIVDHPLKQLPPRWVELTHIQELVIHSTQINALPNDLSSLVNLKSITLRNNAFEEFPVALFTVPQLQVLDMSLNYLQHIPPSIKQLHLKELSLDQNQLISLPEELWELTTLEELEIWGNPLKSISPNIKQLSNLRELYMAQIELTELPPEIGQCSQLNHLEMEQNYLKMIPSEIGQCSQLKYLSLAENQLQALPKEIGLLNQLEELYLNKNQLTELPSEIQQLSKLKYLNLAQNPMSTPTQNKVRQWLPHCNIEFF